MANLALFDFDHTLYRKDSLVEFTKFYAKSKFYRGLIMLSPWLMGLKLRILNNERVKLKYVDYFFADASYEQFCSAASKFSKTKIAKDLDPKVFQNFKKHLKNGDDVFIVTASAAEWILPWSSQYNVHVIGTKWRVEAGKLTGKFDSINCYGIEKVHRINKVIDLKKYDNIFVYGRGNGDKEMLKLRTIL